MAKTRLERAVEIKTNRSTQNENNLKKLKLCRISGKATLTTNTLFVCDDDGLTAQTSANSTQTAVTNMTIKRMLENKNIYFT